MQRIDDLIAQVGVWPQLVAAPYRINPLGAHVDHQGGSVLGRSIDLYTVFGFSAERYVRVSFLDAVSRFEIEDEAGGSGWDRYLRAAVRALQARHPLHNGIRGAVAGSLLGAGLSSSASVVLAYLTALAAVNRLALSKEVLVELVRQVENDHMGLDNGVQDQMCIAYSQHDGLAIVDSRNRSVAYAPDPPAVAKVCWLLAYSGFSRELVGSGFNTRVAECRAAAQLLDPQATILGEVSAENWARLPELPDMLQRRARHYLTETTRVAVGATLWQQGDWAAFGRKMNESCHSSITQYQSGSQPVNKLHEIMSSAAGVFGSRFCGGGYGGCAVALVAREAVESASAEIYDRYLRLYPEKSGIVQVFQVSAVDGVIVIDR